jgi:hypothetical protein
MRAASKLVEQTASTSSPSSSAPVSLSLIYVCLPLSPLPHLSIHSVFGLICLIIHLINSVYAKYTKIKNTIVTSLFIQAKRKHEDDVKSPSEKPPLKKQSTSLSSVTSHASSHSSAPPLKKSKSKSIHLYSNLPIQYILGLYINF